MICSNLPNFSARYRLLWCVVTASSANLRFCSLLFASVLKFVLLCGPHYEFFLSSLTKSFRYITNQLFSGCVESKKRKKTRPQFFPGKGRVTSELKRKAVYNVLTRFVISRFKVIQFGRTERSGKPQARCAIYAAVLPGLARRSLTGLPGQKRSVSCQHDSRFLEASQKNVPE